MGLVESCESFVEKNLESLKEKSSILRFAGFKENDEELLKNRQVVEDVFYKSRDVIHGLASFTGVSGPVNIILKIAQCKICDASLQDAMLELNIERAVVDTVHSLVSAELSGVQRQLNLINDPQLSTAEKQAHLKIADDSCYKLLVKLCDNDFYFRKYPLVFAPFLMSFVAVYVPIAVAHYRLTPTQIRRDDCIENFKKLTETLIHFKSVAVLERLKYIKIPVNPNDPYISISKRTFISDQFLKENQNIYSGRIYSSMLNILELYKYYCALVAINYSEYFNPALETLKNIKLDN